MARAASSWEEDPHYRGDDHIAAVMVPGFVRKLLHARLGRAVYRRFLAPRGLYEYVIARTRYIDAAFRHALADGFDQIVIFGAGFDSRALRFQAELRGTRVFEMDVPLTQSAKLDRYRQCNLSVPANLAFIAMDFERESICEKLPQSGFDRRGRSLFILEGVLMYLLPASADAIFESLHALASGGSRVVFDYVRASVLRGDNSLYGEAGAARAVEKANEGWHFGLDPEQVGPYLATYGFTVCDHADSAALERLYFKESDGHTIARINATHCLVTAERMPVAAA